MGTDWAARAAVVLLTVACTSPARAQIDLSGTWAGTFHEDLPHRGGMRLADYTGLPLNEAGWRKGHSWDEAARSTRERQCIPHVATYALRGPATIQFSRVLGQDEEQLVAYSLHGSYGRPRTIWMDGRPHPSDLAPHTWTGYSTGGWQQNALVVFTTHIKAGWLQRNGAPTSDLATMTEHFIRHGEYLMVVTIVNDPVYLSEPFIRTTNFVLTLTGNANTWGPCGPSQVIDELPGRAHGSVPHYLPDQVEHIREFVTRTGVPPAAARGGAETIYPEYVVKLNELMRSTDAMKQAADGPPQGATPARVEQGPASDDVRLVPVQGSVSMIARAGSNIAVQVGEDGVLVVDTGSGRTTDKVLSAIRQLSDKPIRFILNTHAHLDSTGGNEALARAGRRIGGGTLVGASTGSTATVIAHEAVLAVLSAPIDKPGALPPVAWPTDAYPGDSKEVYTNGEAIQLFHQPAAHTDGDSIVFFRRSDVLVTGDIYDNTGYPVIDSQRGGTFTGVIDALNRIIDIAIPKDWEEGGTMVIPGRGRVADEADVVEYRDMLTIIRDRIEDLIKKGMTLEQVQAARPTFEYDGRYGAGSGPWTTAMFVEAAYQDLSRKRSRP
jgi:glyoxylase-like metal-dependent hydrolase (beta-lactamase superfamily II)